MNTDTRTLLKNGDTLSLGGSSFTIGRTLRRGQTFICYEARLDGSPGRLKELYPADVCLPGGSRYYGIERSASGRLIPLGFAGKQKFENLCRDYARAYEAIGSERYISPFRVFAEEGGVYIWTPEKSADAPANALSAHIPEESPAAIRETLYLARSLSDCVRQLHEKGLLHLDISPRSLHLSPAGRLILRDTEGIHPVGSGLPMAGADGYRAPEVLSGRAENRSDIYSIGAVLANSLTKTESLPSGCRDALRTITQKCLARHPRERYSCCEELTEQLDALIGLVSGRIPP